MLQMHRLSFFYDGHLEYYFESGQSDMLRNGLSLVKKFFVEVGSLPGKYRKQATRSL